MKRNNLRRGVALLCVLALLTTLCPSVVATGTSAEIIYEAENYYSGKIKENAAADMQPGESITFTLADDFISDWYTLSVVSCGNRTLYKVLVNGAEEATVRRSGSGFGLNQMTANEADTMLFLKPGDILAIAAPSDATYGWVDCFKLNVYTGDIQNEDYFIYDVEDYYSGTIKENAAADMQPGESIDIPLPADFSGGRYTVSINSCGNRTNFKIYVNDVSYGDISRSGTGFGMNQMTLDELEKKILTLSAGDVITVVAPTSGYGWVDYVRLDAYKTADAIETQVDGYRYHAEAFYDKLPSSGDAAADMQPNTQFDVELALNDAFQAGKYTLSITSCGNRRSFEIMVNGKYVGTINRVGSNFGMNHMSTDALQMSLELSKSDVITVVAPADGYGWVDYIELSKSLPPEATKTGDGYYIYHTEYFYDGTIKENVAADMQPGEKISHSLSANKDFVAGEYWVAVYSCGSRESIEVQVNGERVGNILRTATGYGRNQMTYDRLDVSLTLRPEDVITIVSPDGYYGWVDYLILSEYDGTGTNDAELAELDTRSNNMSSSITYANDIQYVTVHKAQENGHKFLLGASILKYGDVWICAYGQGLETENDTGSRFACKYSYDNCQTWSDEVVIAGAEENYCRSHGVLFEYENTVWAFCPRAAFGTEGTESFPGLIMEAYTLQPDMTWKYQGVALDDSFWPLCEPVVLENGQVLMAGLDCRDSGAAPAVALSSGDMMQWEFIRIPNRSGVNVWGETSVIDYGDRQVAFVRTDTGSVAVSESLDYGKSWSALVFTDMKIANSKVYGGTLSTGSKYLIYNLGTRATMMIAVGDTDGSYGFNSMYLVRNGFETEPASTFGRQWAYPYAVEEDGYLYVVYSEHKENCELAIIPITSLGVNKDDTTELVQYETSSNEQDITLPEHRVLCELVDGSKVWWSGDGTNGYDNISYGEIDGVPVVIREQNRNSAVKGSQTLRRSFALNTDGINLDNLAFVMTFYSSKALPMTSENRIFWGDMQSKSGNNLPISSDYETYARLDYQASIENLWKEVKAGWNTWFISFNALGYSYNAENLDTFFAIFADNSQLSDGDMIFALSSVRVIELIDEEQGAEITGQQLLLADDLSMRFSVTVDSAYSDAVISATVAGNSFAWEVSNLTAQEDGTYFVVVDLAAAQMTDDITLSVTSGNKVLTENTYSIRAYCVELLEGNYAESVKDLVKQTLNYGAAAQLYFEYNTDNLANAGYELNTFPTPPTDAAKISVDGKIIGINFYGASLLFNTKISVRYYFVTAESLENVNFSVNNTPLKVAQKDGMYYVDVADINPQDYDQNISLLVTKGHEALHISYSPMHYIVRMYHGKGSNELKTLLQAMYAYHLEAKDWLAIRSRAGQYISILGASTSTFDGYSNSEQYNSSIKDNAVYYPKEYLSDVNDTWWMRTINTMDLKLCVNNSWSGSCVTTKGGAKSAGCMERATQLHNDQQNIEPDIIVLIIGGNDVLKGYEIGTYNNLNDIYNGQEYIGDCSLFGQAYATMVHKVQLRYPNADIYVCSMLNWEGNNQNNALVQYNEMIQKIASEFDVSFVDFYNGTDISPKTKNIYLHSDGIHPNQAGFAQMSDCIVESLKTEFLK